MHAPVLLTEPAHFAFDAPVQSNIAQNEVSKIGLDAGRRCRRLGLEVAGWG